MKSLAERVDGAFAPYERTLDTLDRCIAERSDPTEFIILACARLDSLANIAFDVSQQERFCRLLREHSGQQQLLEQVSVPDRFYELDHQLFMVDGTLRAPGRLTIYDDRGNLFVRVLVSSDLALDSGTARRLLKLFLGLLRKNYRVSPRQRGRLPTTASVDSVCALFEAHANTRGGRPYASALTKMKRTVHEHTLDRLLY